MNTAALCEVEQTPYFETNNVWLALQGEEVASVPIIDGGVDVDEEQSQTVAFLDKAEGESVMASNATDAVAIVDGTKNLALGQFFARPTRLSTISWTTSDASGVHTTLTPWLDFLGSTAIKRKLENFAFLRGKLHLKAVMNASPFHYGCGRFCYSPLEGYTGSKIRTNTTTDTVLEIPYSQQPGFYVHPSRSAGGTMELPFLLHKNWLDITYEEEVEFMGTLRFVVFYPLSLATAAATTATTIQLYAWMTDVELCATTNSLSLQGDEYVESGPVSAPATALASLAHTLTHVPFIGKFARATEIGAGALASIARLFGYTNAPVVDDVHAVVPLGAPHLATSQIGIPIQKLTLDPKQELSLDPTPFGLSGKDELSLAYLKKKESLFGSTSWSTSDAVGTQLFNMRLTPMLFGQVEIEDHESAVVATRVYHMPLSYVGQLFKNWRGGLLLRIKIVASKFHRGRLKIQYDPRSDITTNDPDENVVYTQIVDIGEQDDDEIVIELPYHQDTAWLDVDKSLATNWTLGDTCAPTVGLDNGVLSIRVLTALNAPSSSSVGLLIFVAGADDFEFANPVGRIASTGSHTLPSFFGLQGAEEVSPSHVVLGEKTSVSSDRYGMNFGEAVVSLRTLLHRHMIADVTWLPTISSSQATYTQKVMKIMPYTPGFTTLELPTTAPKIVAASGTGYYAFCSMHVMPYVAGMFVGYRGGANFVVTPDLVTDTYFDLRVLRTTEATSAAARIYYQTPVLSTTASTSVKNEYSNSIVLQSGHGGMAIGTAYVNGSLVFNLPDNKRFNFSFVNPDNYLQGSADDGTNEQGAIVQLLQKRATTFGTIQTEVGAGVDFTCIYFVCCPTLDYYGIVPPST